MPLSTTALLTIPTAFSIEIRGAVLYAIFIPRLNYATNED